MARTIEGVVKGKTIGGEEANRLRGSKTHCGEGQRVRAVCKGCPNYCRVSMPPCATILPQSCLFDPTAKPDWYEVVKED